MSLYESIGSDKHYISSLTLALTNGPSTSRIKLDLGVDTLHFECVIRSKQYEFRTIIFETVTQKRTLQVTPKGHLRLFIGDSVIIKVSPVFLKISAGSQKLHLSWNEPSTDVDSPIEVIRSFA